MYCNLEGLNLLDLRYQRPGIDIAFSDIILSAVKSWTVCILWLCLYLSVYPRARVHDGGKSPASSLIATLALILSGVKDHRGVLYSLSSPITISRWTASSIMTLPNLVLWVHVAINRIQAIRPTSVKHSYRRFREGGATSTLQRMMF